MRDVPRCREAVLERWMDEGEEAVITGLVVRLEGGGSCFSTATLH